MEHDTLTMATLRRVQGAFEGAVETIVEGFDDIQKAPSSIQNASRVVNINNQFYLVPSGVNPFRDYDYDASNPNHSTQNGGTVTFSDGEYLLNTDTQTDSRAVLSTVNIGEYRSGSVGIAGFYQRLEVPLQGDEYARGGFYYPDGVNGLYTNITPDGLEFVVEALGEKTRFKRYEGDWDTEGLEDAVSDSDNVTGQFVGIDPLDGTGVSGARIGPTGDPTPIVEGTIWRIDFTWYGGGAIVLSRVTLLRDGKQRETPVVIYKPAGRVSFPQPNQPVTLELSSERDITHHAAGRQFGTTGNVNINKKPVEHITPSSITVPTGNYVILGMFKRKDGVKGLNIGLGDASLDSDQPLSVHARIVPELSGSADPRIPSDHQSQNVDVEVGSLESNGGLVGGANVDTTTDDGGNTVLSGGKWGGTIKGSEAGPFGFGQQSTTSNLTGFEFPVPRDEWCAIMARSVGGAAATVTPSFNILEAR